MAPDYEIDTSGYGFIVTSWYVDYDGIKLMPCMIEYQRLSTITYFDTADEHEDTTQY